MFGRFRRTGDVVGFALSGGGARGACQVGALKALTEAGIWPQVIAGTSAGSVNAAWFALFPHRLDRLEAIWMAIRRRDVFPGSRVRVVFNISRHGYVHASEPWEAFLRRQVGAAQFEEMAIPCAVVAVRLSDGQRVVFDSGEVVPAIMASTAIPGIFPPYRIGDELYVDGGVLEYLPVPTLLERSATTVYALDCSWLGPQVDDRSSIVDRCGRIGAAAAVQAVTSISTTRGRKVHLLRPELPEIGDARDFRHTAELILAGYEQAQRYLQNGPHARPQERVADSTPSAS
jgi:NTE family protein